MSSLFRSVTITYRDAEGRRCRKGDPGASPHRVISKRWYGRFRDGQGRVRTVALATDKGVARAMLASKEREARMESIGLGDKFSGHRKTPLVAHLEDYRRYQIAEGNTARYVTLTCDRIGKVLEGCRFVWIDDFSADRVVVYLASLRKRGMAIGTSNHYLRAIKMFSAWLQRHRRTGEDELRFLSRLNADTDRRRVRRALSHAEFSALIEAARTSHRVVCGLAGPDRAMLYLVAAYTGWRASELASLTVSSFDFEAGIVVTEAAYSKHRRRDEIPLHPDLVRQLRTWTAVKPPHTLLWPGKWAEGRHGAEMLRADMATAGLPYTDPSGRVFDFHALRGQFSSSLARAGVHPKSAQMLLRHSTIDLTMRAYTHLEMRDLRADVERLPTPPDAIGRDGTRDEGRGDG